MVQSVSVVCFNQYLHTHSKINRTMNVLRSLILLCKCALTLSLVSSKYGNLNRRAALTNIVSIPAATSVLTVNPPLASSAYIPANDVFTLVVDSPDSSNIGIKFVDTTIDGKEVPIVDKVESESSAARYGVKQGMVLLGRDSATKSSSKNIDFRLRNGPYPFVLQFTSPDGIVRVASSNSGQQQTIERALDPYDRIDVKTVQKPSNCVDKAKSGDSVTISYEARISSSNGIIYDSTSWRQGEPATFQLGKGATLPGVEIGLNGMCVGEVREIDVPTSLGYGKFGSQVFDIPGDVRLWWRVELLDLTKGKKKYRLF